MSKAYILLDMPHNCGECPVGTRMNTGTYEDYVKCRKTNKCHCADSKPDWCPAKELPKKQELTFHDPGQDAITLGWNACIEEIEK